MTFIMFQKAQVSFINTYEITISMYEMFARRLFFVIFLEIKSTIAKIEQAINSCSMKM